MHASLIVESKPKLQTVPRVYSASTPHLSSTGTRSRSRRIMGTCTELHHASIANAGHAALFRARHSRENVATNSEHAEERISPAGSTAERISPAGRMALLRARQSKEVLTCDGCSPGNTAERISPAGRMALLRARQSREGLACDSGSSGPPTVERTLFSTSCTATPTRIEFIEQHGDVDRSAAEGDHQGSATSDGDVGLESVTANDRSIHREPIEQLAPARPDSSKRVFLIALLCAACAFLGCLAAPHMYAMLGSHDCQPSRPMSLWEAVDADRMQQTWPWRRLLWRP